MTHPLLDVMTNAARGMFPPVDGGVTHLPGLPDGNRAILALTGHAFIAADLDAAEVRGLIDLGIDGFGGALAPQVVLRIADGAAIGVNDVALVASGTGRGTTLPTTTAWDEHPRVLHARHLRAGVTVFGDRRGFVTVAAGLAGRTELSVEVVDSGCRDAGGLGRQFIAEALGAAQSREPVFAAVSPGNARSLRSFLAAGFVPIGSEVILDRSDRV